MTSQFSGTCDEYLRQRLGEIEDGAHIRTRSAVGGGCINHTEVLELNSGRRVFLKRNDVRLKGLFRGEARGLSVLSDAGGLRVPAVLGQHEDDRDQLLLLEFIPAGSKCPGFWEHFAAGLATVHRNSSAAGCGFDEDNHIGATEQPNGWEKRWLTFFAEKRIGFQLELARKRGRADSAMQKAGERFIARIQTILPEPESSSLLHGDLWGGNYMVDQRGEAVLIDPAVYYGHREADIALTELFGGFNARFYAAYNEVWPMAPGYADRRDAYNLYHLLNHLNLFGGSYASSVMAVLNHYS